MKYKRIKYLWLFFGMPLVFILLIYIGISLRFINSFCYGTLINGVDYTGENVDYVNNELLKGFNDYRLIIKDREGTELLISGRDINLSWDVRDKLQEIKKGQNCFLWALKGVNHKVRYQVDINVKFDEALLDKKIKEFVTVQTPCVTEMLNKPVIE